MGFFKKLFSSNNTSSEKHSEERDQITSPQVEESSDEASVEVAESSESEDQSQPDPGTVSFDVFRVDGIRTMQMGQYDYAIECFKRALAIEEDEEVHQFLVSAYIRSDNLPLASEELEKMCSLYPDNPEHKVHLANIYYQMEIYSKSIAICESLQQSSPELAYSDYLLAKICVAQGDWSSAEIHANHAIEKRSDFEESYLLRSQILLNLSRLEDALTDIDHLLEHDPNLDEWLLQKANVLNAMSKADEAILYYNKVIAENPFMEEAYAQLSALYLQQGSLEEAETILAEGLEQTGESIQLIATRALLKEAQGDHAGAEADKALAAQLASTEKEHEDEHYDVEKEMQDRLNSINPFQ